MKKIFLYWIIAVLGVIVLFFSIFSGWYFFTHHKNDINYYPKNSPCQKYNPSDNPNKTQDQTTCNDCMEKYYTLEKNGILAPLQIISASIAVNCNRLKEEARMSAEDKIIEFFKSKNNEFNQYITAEYGLIDFLPYEDKNIFLLEWGSMENYDKIPEATVIIATTDANYDNIKFYPLNMEENYNLESMDATPCQMLHVEDNQVLYYCHGIPEYNWYVYNFSDNTNIKIANYWYPAGQVIPEDLKPKTTIFKPELVNKFLNLENLFFHKF